MDIGINMYLFVQHNTISNKTIRTGHKKYHTVKFPNPINKNSPQLSIPYSYSCLFIFVLMIALIVFDTIVVIVTIAQPKKAKSTKHSGSTIHCLFLVDTHTHSHKQSIKHRGQSLDQSLNLGPHKTHFILMRGQQRT